MRRALSIVTVVLCLVPAPSSRAEELSKTEAAGEWVSLFDGKSLEGWVPKITGYPLGENFGNTFRVEDGFLSVGYEAYEDFGGRFGHLIYDKPFSHYRFRVEYRFVGDQVAKGPGWAFRNSGIMFHGQKPETMTKDQNFPVSVEVQLLGGRESGERSTANVCSPGTHIVMDGKLVKRHCNSSKSKTYRGDQWVTVELEVRGNALVKHIIDGETVLEYAQPQLDPGDADAKKLIQDGETMLSSGYISLQSESHPVQFRRVEIMVLEE